MLNLYEEHRGDLAMKFYEKLSYCKDLIRGNVYMKENAYFRHQEDTYRGDRFDGRAITSWKGDVVPITFSDGETVDVQIINDIEYGIPNDDKIPIFCTSIFDGAILERPNSSNLFMQYFIDEISQFGEFAVCFSIKEFKKRAERYAQQNNYHFLSGKVLYCEKDSPWYSHREEGAFFEYRDLFSALFTKDYFYRWQNEWRGILLNHGNTIIPSWRDFHVMELGELDNAFICKTEHIVNAKLLHGQAMYEEYYNKDK